jgi:hypothetical protein
MNHFWPTFLTLSGWALEVIVVPPVLVVFCSLVISLVAATLKQSPFKKRLWKNYHWLIFTQILFFPTAIAIGVIWEVPLPLGHPNPHALIIRDVVWYASLGSCVFWIWRTKGFRWYGASLLILQQLLVEAALFITSMSITGTWL